MVIRRLMSLVFVLPFIALSMGSADVGPDATSGGGGGKGGGSGSTGSGSGSSGGIRFACRAGDLCVEYWYASTTDGQAARAQCGVVVTQCTGGGTVKTCGHSVLSQRSSCTFTTNPPANHDKACTDTDGRTGCTDP